MYRGAGRAAGSVFFQEDTAVAQFYDALNPELRQFIEAQPMFFTATAPGLGRINLSPKAMDTFRIFDDHTVAYLDLTGSGNETAAHLRENGRITVMFCSFGKTPMVVRLYGHGRTILKADPQWSELHQHFPARAGARQIMMIAVESAMKSCGWNVPRMELVQRRDGVARYWARKGDKAVVECWSKFNSRSIDGLDSGIINRVEGGASIASGAGVKAKPAAEKKRSAMAVARVKPSAR